MGILRLSSTPRVMRHMYADTTVCTSYLHLLPPFLGAVTLCDVSSLVTQHQGLLFYKQYDVRCSQIRSRPSRSAMNFNPGTALMSEIRPADVSRSKCCYITVYQCPSVVVDSPVSPEFPGVLLVRISSVKREKGSCKVHDWSSSHPGSATGVLWALSTAEYRQRCKQLLAWARWNRRLNVEISHTTKLSYFTRPSTSSIQLRLGSN